MPPPPGYGTPYPPPPRGSTPLDFTALGVSTGEPKRRGVRKIWMLIAVVLIAASVVSVTHGVVEIVDINDATVTNAVARAEVNGQTNIARFTATKSQTYTVYGIIDTNSSDQRNSVVAATSCDVHFADGSSTSFSGAQQGSSTTINDVATIGQFHANEGAVTVVCDSGYGNRFDFIVTPGTSNVGAAIGFILGGALGLALGIAALIRALIGRKRIVTDAR